MARGPLQVVASVLPADLARLGGDCQALEKAGGIGPGTAARAAGADVLCAGSALCAHPDGPAVAVGELRAVAEEAHR